MSKKSVLEFFSNEIAISNPELAFKSAQKIVLKDEDGDRLIFEGSGLVIKNGMLKSGEIDTFLIETKDGKSLLSFTHIDIDVATLPSSSPVELVQFGLIYGLRHDNVILGSKGTDEINGLIGNDVMKGRGGDDFLGGGAGKDVLYGGSGEDQFDFEKGNGKDRIMDFDADGSDGKQDLIDTDLVYLSIKDVKGNAVINFGDGDTITLVGVKASEIDASDFVV